MPGRQRTLKTTAFKKATAVDLDGGYTEMPEADYLDEVKAQGARRIGGIPSGYEFVEGLWGSVYCVIADEKPATLRLYHAKAVG